MSARRKKEPPDDPDTRQPVPLWTLVRERRDARERWPFGDEPVEFTCDACAYAPRCRLAFDFYNTNGDCLLEK